MTDGRKEEIGAWAEGSAFVGSDGLPATWFHATNADDFNVFTRWDDFSIGFHFGTREVAGSRLADLEPDAGRVMEVFCRAVNPLRLTDLYTWEQDRIASALMEAGVISEDEREWLVDSASCEAVFAALEEAGYDAVVYGNECEFKERITDSLMVWRAELLKRVDSHGFDRDDPKLLAQNGAGGADMRSWRELSVSIGHEREALRRLRTTAIRLPAA